MDTQGNSAASRDIAYHLHPYTNFRVHEREGPLVITRGEGVRVFDEAGKSYIEGLAGLWCTALGFNEPRLIEAAKRQLETLPFCHGFGGRASNVIIDLAEALIAMAPVPMSKVFFANSGSEANDTAVKIVWYYNNARGRPKKKKIISRHKAYHGVTVATAGLTGLPNNHRDFDLPIKNIVHTDCPHHYRFARDGESEEAFATRCADNLEKLILEEGPDTVAAFFAEPIMGAGGVIVPPATYFEKVQAVVRKYDLLFLADEVICGFGRTGNMWGCQTFDLKPDMITVAKALSSAYLPISGLMVSEDIYQAMVTESDKIGIFAHGFTYSGHPVPAAVALEALRLYEERQYRGPRSRRRSALAGRPRALRRPPAGRRGPRQGPDRRRRAGQGQAHQGALRAGRRGLRVPHGTRPRPRPDHALARRLRRLLATPGHHRGRDRRAPGKPRQGPRRHRGHGPSARPGRFATLRRACADGPVVGATSRTQV